MRSKQKKPYHHGDLREQLLLAGEAALAEMPIESVSLREIARRAGVSHAAPKHHFASMGDLLGEIAARGFDRFVAHIAKAADQPRDQTPEARLMAMGRAYLAFAEANPAVYGLMFGKLDQCNKTENFFAAAMRAWAQLEEGVAAKVGEEDAKDGALLVWSFVHGLAMLTLENRLPPNLRVAQNFEKPFRMIIAGMSAA
jgi:AcrR family transcriptional regulator